MKIRFQADNDLDQRIVAATRRLAPEIDFKTAVAAGLHDSVPDPRVLEIAADAGRVLVTNDRRTMPTHFGDLLASRHSPGVIIVPKSMQIGLAAEWLHLIWASSEAEEFADVLYQLPRE
ncbi:MAG: DUF5615 family PIN-like protein [Acidobacteria bacterium]|nr:DUF5615 family PIN-like protein [Acidobacteriota bacterium]